MSGPSAQDDQLSSRQLIVCKTCGTEKDEDYFHRHASTATKRHPSCKECRKTERRVRHTVNRDRACEQMRAYYQANGEVIRQRVSQWQRERRTDPEYVKKEPENNREWRRRNREKMAAANARQRARGRFTPNWTDEEWKKLCDHYGHRCLACGEDGPLQLG